MRYSVVGSSDLEAFEALVNDALADGCELVGGMAVTEVETAVGIRQSKYYQAVLVPDEGGGA